jgi:hypothetical protein
MMFADVAVVGLGDQDADVFIGRLMVSWTAFRRSLTPGPMPRAPPIASRYYMRSPTGKSPAVRAGDRATIPPALTLDPRA